MPAAAQNVVLNGGFERGEAQQACEWVLHGVGSTTLQSWNVLDGNVDRQRLVASCDETYAGWRSYEGEFTVDLNGFSSGAIEQSIDVLPGQPMRLRFMLTGNCGALTVGLSRLIQVEIGGTTWTFDHQCVAEYPQPWVEHVVEFTPKTSRTSITFRSLTPDTTLGPVIDAVSVEQAVEPCSADVVQNGFVDGPDLAAILTAWGTDGGIYPRADTNADGVVDGADLATVLGGWGACP